MISRPAAPPRVPRRPRGEFVGLVGLLFIAVALPGAATAQEVERELRGRAVDGNGLPVPNARIVAVVGTRVSAEARTDREGAFTLALDGRAPISGGGPDPDTLVTLQATATGFRSLGGVAVPPGRRDGIVLELRRLPFQREAVPEGQVLGRVFDEAGRPLPDVVVLAEGRMAATTGRTGGYDFAWSGPPELTLRFEHLGHEVVEREIEVAPSQGVFIDVTLPTRPVELPEIRVQALPEQTLADVRRLRHSVRAGGGNYLTARDFARKGHPPMRYLFSTIPFMSVRNGVPFFRRHGGEKCPPTFWIDGVKLGHWSYAADLQTLDIELLEAYQGPASIPGAYIDSDARCGVIVLWTKRGSAVSLTEIVEALQGRRSGG